jgi:peptide-methionine (S)-S-oxide reductase
MANDTKSETIVFGGGCFWCTEAVFKMLNGVESVTSGYAGGHTENPTYREVTSGTTGHAESAQVVYDPSKVTFRDLLTIFFASHDATTLNRQGADVGTQYRSIIFYTTEKQKEEIEAFIKELTDSSPDGNPIVTEVEPLKVFYPAEDYHQDYYENNASQGYCQIVIAPKLQKVQAHYAELLKKQSTS